MDVKLVDNAVELVKQREGILNSIQDKYITAIVNGAISELEREHGIKADMSKMDIFMFVVDLSAYRYSNRDSLEGLPKNLEFRLRNLYLQECNDTETIRNRNLGLINTENKNSNNTENANLNNTENRKRTQVEIDRIVKEIQEDCRGDC